MRASCTMSWMTPSLVKWWRAPQALSHLAAAAYNHPARAEEILNAVETLAARWGMAAHVYPGKSGGAPAE